MSPEYMASQSRCVDACPCIPRLRRKIRLLQAAGFTIQLFALMAIAAGFPVEGLPGVGLALGGMALVWVGWYLAVRRPAPLKAASRQQRSPRR
jgi:hypothetical protein